MNPEGERIRDAILTCTQKLTWNQQLKSGKTEKLESKKTGMLRSISKQSGETMESVPKKKRKAAVGRICRKGKF